MWCQLKLFISRLTQKMNRMDRRLELLHLYTVSIVESTKLGLLDEVDFQLHATALAGSLHQNDIHMTSL